MKHIWINIDENLKRQSFMYKQFNDNNLENDFIQDQLIKELENDEPIKKSNNKNFKR